MCLEAFEWPLETSKYVDAVVPPQPWGVIASLVLWHPEQLYPDTQWRPLTPKPPILQTTTIVKQRLTFQYSPNVLIWRPSVQWILLCQTKCPHTSWSTSHTEQTAQMPHEPRHFLKPTKDFAKTTFTSKAVFWCFCCLTSLTHLSPTHCDAFCSHFQLPLLHHHTQKPISYQPPPHGLF